VSLADLKPGELRPLGELNGRHVFLTARGHALVAVNSDETIRGYASCVKCGQCIAGGRDVVAAMADYPCKPWGDAIVRARNGVDTAQRYLHHLAELAKKAEGKA
jgi:hypothetical protein